MLMRCSTYLVFLLLFINRLYGRADGEVSRGGRGRGKAIVAEEAVAE